MIQFELSLVYFATFCAKVKGAPWLQGTAMYYIYHLDEFKRFPVPSWFLHPMMLKVEGWFGLVLEFSLGVLIWVKELRYILLALGVLFHLCRESTLNIPLFQWDILSAYVLFVDAGDITRAWDWIRTRTGTPRRTGRAGSPRFPSAAGCDEKSRRLGNTIKQNPKIDMTVESQGSKSARPGAPPGFRLSAFK